MAKPEWGVKRACLACGTRFYDMQKAPILCPSCGAKISVVRGSQRVPTAFVRIGYANGAAVTKLERVITLVEDVACQLSFRDDVRLAAKHGG